MLVTKVGGVRFQAFNASKVEDQTREVPFPLTDI